jgi:hypothetical protein
MSNEELLHRYAMRISFAAAAAADAKPKPIIVAVEGVEVEENFPFLEPLFPSAGRTRVLH